MLLKLYICSVIYFGLSLMCFTLKIKYSLHDLPVIEILDKSKPVSNTTMCIYALLPVFNIIVATSLLILCASDKLWDRFIEETNKKYKDE